VKTSKDDDTRWLEDRRQRDVIRVAKPRPPMAQEEPMEPFVDLPLKKATEYLTEKAAKIVADKQAAAK
jgi:hypothetical protein